MKVLVLGGTRFLGRAVVSCAAVAGHEITCFRRGIAGSIDQPVQLVRGDREDIADIARLAASGEWDAVIDTSAYVPRWTKEMAVALEPVVARYVVVSTVAVYRDWPTSATTEDSPVFVCPPNAVADTAGYGTLKSGCETAVREVFGPDRTTVLRPGAILGPHDYLGRLPWWLRRIARGGRVLAPGDPGRAITPVDVRDVAAFALRCAHGRGGTFNVAGPPDSATMTDLLSDCRSVTGSRARLFWVTDEEWLARQGITPWTGLPLWRREPEVWQVDASRARQAGFTTRPLLDTVADTWDWLSSSADDAATATEGNGISAETEQALLTRWDKLKAQAGQLGAANAADSTG